MLYEQLEFNYASNYINIVTMESCYKIYYWLIIPKFYYYYYY